MKSIIFLVTCILFLGFQVSCKEKKENTTKDAVEKTTQETVTAENPAEVSTQEKKIQKKITLIELGSVKCVPCKMMTPILEEIKKEYPDTVEVVFYDVWTQAGQPYAEQYKIRAIPTQVFLDKNGKEYFRHEGFFPKVELVKILEKGLAQ